MKLFSEVVNLLQHRGVSHALVGAGAMAVLGASRSTQDLDLLTTDCRVLATDFWHPLTASHSLVDVRLGDAHDPITGVVRLARERERPVDLIVGEAPWQRRVIAEAVLCEIGDTRVPAVDATGLILLKLYAGGPQDMWDVEQVLALTGDPAALQATVETRLADLPQHCRRLWRRIKAAHRQG